MVNLFCQEAKVPNRALAVLLSRIRQQYGSGALLSDGEMVQLNLAEVAVDVTQFVAILEGHLAQPTDALPYALLLDASDTSSWNLLRWHPTQANTIIHFDDNSDTTLRLQFTDVTNGQTTVFTFPAPYERIRSNQSFDEISRNGRYVIFATDWGSSICSSPVDLGVGVFAISCEEVMGK